MTQNPNFHPSLHSDPRRRVSTHYYQQPPQPQGYNSPVPVLQRRTSQLPHRPLSRRRVGHPRRYLLGGSMLALATLVVIPSIQPAADPVSRGAGDLCIKQIDQQSLISRNELEALLNLDSKVPRANVQAIVDHPHCVLEARAGEDGVQVEREAYPLEFDPQTWFVLLYQDGKYTGYDFSFR